MLLDRADRDIYNARLLISPAGNPNNDELINDIAAYHVQQGIETTDIGEIKTKELTDIGSCFNFLSKQLVQQSV